MLLIMTSKERVRLTIERKSTDRTPYSFDFTSAISSRLAVHYNIKPQKLHDFIGDDLYYIGAGIVINQTESSIVTEFGVRWDTSQNNSIGDWGSILEYPLKEATLDNYSFPDGGDERRFSELDSAALKTNDRFVLLHMAGLFDLCWHLRGFENFIADMISEQDFAEKLLDRALRFSLEFVEAIPDGVDGVRIGEDWGMQKGLITGAFTWRKLLKPRLRVLYNAVRARNLKLFIHSCGDIEELFPDLIEMGVDVVHPVQPEVMNLTDLHNRYGGDIIMYGGIGTQSTLIYGTPDDVITEAKSNLKLFNNGGYILGPAGAISTDAKIENVIALTDFVMSLQR